MNRRPSHPGRRPWLRLPGSLAVIYLALSMFGCLWVEKLMFMPPAAGYPRDLPGILTLDTTRGESIAAVHRPAAGGKPTLLYSHGNAEDLGGVLPLLEPLHRRGFGIFAYDYPGYGHSTGEPTEHSCERAIEACWNRLTGPLGVPPSSIIVVGRSIGSGPAVWLASRHDPAGLVLVSPLMSVYRVRLPAPILPGDRFPNLRRIRSIEHPLLVIHGESDRIITPDHGRRLFEAHPGPDKELFTVPGAGHNDLFHQAGPEIERRIADFATRTAR